MSFCRSSTVRIALAISASLIRDLVRNGHSVRYLLPDSVLDYIAAHHLYR